MKVKVEAFAVEEKVSESRLRKVEEVGLTLAIGITVGMRALSSFGPSGHIWVVRFS